MRYESLAFALAHEDFYFFSRWMMLKQRNIQWQRNSHHKVICAALMRVYNGECKRLILNLPPRYSKTVLAVVNFIAWTMGRHPDSEFIHASYSSTLAVENSANVQSLLAHEAYQSIFPDCKLASTVKHHWKTTAGGVLYATGSGGTITGFGAGKARAGFAGSIILDDLHKADEAKSDVMRTNVIEWFQNTIESRCNSPHTPIIVVMQRLHEQDIAGWLLDGNNGEKWENVIISAINDDGTALWPEKHTLETLQAMEQANAYNFASQYRQVPSPPGGGLFKADCIETVDAIPAMPITWLRGWDFASTTGGDYNAGVKLGKMRDGRFIVADVNRFRELTDKRDAALINTAKRDGREVKISIPQDPGQAGKSLVLYMTRSLAGFRVTSSPESGNKETRAEPVAAQVNVGNVLMLRGEWNDAFIHELRMFPNGAFDDQVDAFSRAFNELIRRNAINISEAALRRV